MEHPEHQQGGNTAKRDSEVDEEGPRVEEHRIKDCIEPIKRESNSNYPTTYGERTLWVITPKANELSPLWSDASQACKLSSKKCYSVRLPDDLQ